MDGKRSAFPELGVLDKNLPLVVVFNDTLRQAQAKSPTAGFRRKAGLKDDLDFRRMNTLSGIADVDLDIVMMRMYLPGDGAGAFLEGIEGIAHDVFDHPVEEGRIDAHQHRGDIFGGFFKHDLS